MKTLHLCAVLATIAAGGTVYASEPTPKPTSASTAVPDKGHSVVRKTKFNLPVLTVRNRLNGKEKGSCHFLPLEISLSGSNEPLRISFSDDTPDGSGQTIRNSLWTAALTAAIQNESALRGVRISLDFKGGMDGPSAGAVMCLGIMTALNGRAFPDDFAMTGTILPDGTVGLVGGIPEKLDAVAKNPRIKRVAIPAFERFAQNADGDWVDLFELGRKLGLELHPVESIGDAYRYLHGETPANEAAVSALAVCREDPTFEKAAAGIFTKRAAALRMRISGLSSNELESVTSGWEWDYVNPENAERRFSEGAIFDALNLIQRADASLSAYLESWKFFDDFDESFISRTHGETKGPGWLSLFLQPKTQSASGKPMHEWPIELQLAYVDGFRSEISDLCERVLGWNSETTEESQEEDEPGETEEPWRGLAPETGSSDLAAQLLSLVEGARAEGTYRFMIRQTFDRNELEEALKNGERSIYQEIDYDRKKLFFLMRERFRRPSFTDVPLPVMNAGPETDAALELFRNAWTIIDRSIENEVVEGLAHNASVHTDVAREYLIAKDLDYAVYDAAKRWGKLFLLLWDEALMDGADFEYPTWTTANFLFNCAELFAEASAQQLALDNETANSSFTAFVTDRARETALRSMDACRKAGIPCFGSVLSFQNAERARAGRDGSATGILSNYWKATMTAKALLIAFKNGIGPAQGFSGYQEPKDEIDAKEAMAAMVGALFNAETGPFLDSLPDSMVEALSLCAATAAQTADDATWEAFQNVLKQGGALLIRQSGILAELITEDEPSPVFTKEMVETAILNWGERLLGISQAASRERIAGGHLPEVLRAAKRHLKNVSKRGSDIQIPAITAHRNADGTIDVSISEWEAPTTVQGLFDSTPDVFRRFDGKMVFADWIPTDPAAMKTESEAAVQEVFNEFGDQLLSVLQVLSETLKSAAHAENKEAFETVFNSLDLSAFVGGGEDDADK